MPPLDFLFVKFLPFSSLFRLELRQLWTSTCRGARHGGHSPSGTAHAGDSEGAIRRPRRRLRFGRRRGGACAARRVPLGRGGKEAGAPPPAAAASEAWRHQPLA